jgi:hypothetical protein
LTVLIVSPIRKSNRRKKTSLELNPLTAVAYESTTPSVASRVTLRVLEMDSGIGLVNQRTIVKRNTVMASWACQSMPNGTTRPTRRMESERRVPTP